MKIFRLLTVGVLALVVNSCGGGGSSGNGTGAPTSLAGATASINPIITFSAAGNAFTYSNSTTEATFNSQFHTTPGGNLSGSYTYIPSGLSGTLILDFTDPTFHDYTFSIGQFGVNGDNYIVSATTRLTAVSSIGVANANASIPTLNQPLLTTFPTGQLLAAGTFSAADSTGTGVDNFPAGTTFQRIFVTETLKPFDSPLATVAAGDIVDFVIGVDGAISFPGDLETLSVPYVNKVGNVYTYKKIDRTYVGFSERVESLVVTLDIDSGLIIDWNISDDGFFFFGFESHTQNFTD